MTAQTRMDDVHGEAVAWFLRLREGRAEDRDAFVDWLEGDPARAEAYDAVELADAELGPAGMPASVPAAANDDDEDVPTVRPRRWPWAAAASVALLAAGWAMIPQLGQQRELYAVTTAPGRQRTVALGDGSLAMLNGGSRLVLDRADRRYAELASGEASFSIRHDPRDPFVVLAAGHRIQDVGTTFNVVDDAGALRVEVIEGRVLYDPGDAELPLAAGQTLRVQGATRVLDRRPPEEMAGWRNGRLSYREASLEVVAADLGRALGVEVSLDPALSTAPFTGTIRIRPDPGATLTEAAALAGATARREGNRWVIGPKANAAR